MTPAARSDESPTDGAVGGQNALELQGLTKYYGDLCACRSVDLQVAYGEIHGLLGENGAGKSTLAKALIGLVPVDAGEVRIGGRPVAIRDPVEASALGIAMVQQHMSLVNRMRVWENVALSLPGKLSRRDMCEHVRECAWRYGLNVDPLARVEALTIGERQRVELVKALARDPSILILDEPTSVLTTDESRDLFTILRRVVVEFHRAVILISHKLEEVLRATDRVTVMRDGAVVLSARTSETTEHSLARAMVGRDVVLQSERAAIGLLGLGGRNSAVGNSVPGTPTSEPSSPVSAQAQAQAQAQAHLPKPVLSIIDLVATGDGTGQSLKGLSLEVHQGEIVGVAGVEGNGQRALCDVLAGLIQPSHGTIQVGALVLDAHGLKPGSTLAAGVGIIPEDRHDSGCVLDLSVAENLCMADLDRFRRARVLVDRRAMVAHAEQLIARFGVVAPSARAPMRSLSGGNQQRVVLARELDREPLVLVAAQPTRGLDVAAIEYMSEQFEQAAAHGVAILLISSDLEEIIALCHRIVVIQAGRIVGAMLPEEFDVERLGRMIGGQVA